MVTPAMKMLNEKSVGCFGLQQSGCDERSETVHSTIGSKKFYGGLRESVIYSHQKLGSIKLSWRILLEFGGN
jgi:hypothetical protein